MSSPSVRPTAPIEVEAPLPSIVLAPPLMSVAVEVEPPGIPSAVLTPPVPGLVTECPASGLVAVPVQGPQGAQGPAGDSAAALAFTYTTSSPAMVHQIHHGLSFKPAGIVAQDADGTTFIGWTVTYPAPGITEVSFGIPVTPTIYLS